MAAKKKKSVKKSPKKVKVPPKKKAKKKAPIKRSISKRISRSGGLHRARLMVTINPLDEKLKREIIALKKQQAKERKAAEAVVKAGERAAKRAFASHKKQLADLKKGLRKAKKKITSQAARLQRSEAAIKGWRKRDARDVIRHRMEKAAEDGRMYDEAKELFIIYDEFFTVGEIYTMGMSP